MSAMTKHNLYTRHFGLSQPPFGLSPQPACFYGGAKREAALQQLHYFAQVGEGIALVSGEVGSGKTMLLTMLLRNCREQKSDTVVPILINRMMLSIEDVLHSLAEQLQVNTQGVTQSHLQASMENALLKSFAEGKRTVVVVDEAHTLPTQCLEWLRLLTNLETPQGKMLQLMLFAQPEILPRLNKPELRALADRITLKIFLLGMNTSETKHYLNHRLHHAGFRGDPLFTDAAVALIARHTGGLLRRVNVLADQALLAAYAQGHTQVTKAHIHLAIAEINTQADPATCYQPASEPIAVDSVRGVGLVWCIARWQAAKSLFVQRRTLALSLLFLLLGLILAMSSAVLWQQKGQPLNRALEPTSLGVIRASPTDGTAPLEEADITSSNLTQWHPAMQWIDPPPALFDSGFFATANYRQNALQSKMYFLRIISKPANVQQADTWLSQLTLTLQTQWGGEPRNRLGEPLKLMVYRFNVARGSVLRVIVVGYRSQEEAVGQIRHWKALMSNAPVTQQWGSDWVVKPLHSLLSQH
jgi:MSHA biogenesis protein MshM